MIQDYSQLPWQNFTTRSFGTITFWRCLSAPLHFGIVCPQPKFWHCCTAGHRLGWVFHDSALTCMDDFGPPHSGMSDSVFSSSSSSMFLPMLLMLSIIHIWMVFSLSIIKLPILIIILIILQFQPTCVDDNSSPYNGMRPLQQSLIMIT